MTVLEDVAALVKQVRRTGYAMTASQTNVTLGSSARKPQDP
ncbi:hypothetical protein [Mesorhizobium sp. CA15]|nr:hypothetical protein [Mesorhizobium sp. CA15]